MAPPLPCNNSSKIVYNLHMKNLYPGISFVPIQLKSNLNTQNWSPNVLVHHLSVDSTNEILTLELFNPSAEYVHKTYREYKARQFFITGFFICSPWHFLVMFQDKHPGSWLLVAYILWSLSIIWMAICPKESQTLNYPWIQHDFCWGVGCFAFNTFHVW